MTGGRGGFLARGGAFWLFNRWERCGFWPWVWFRPWFSAYGVFLPLGFSAMEGAFVMSGSRPWVVLGRENDCMDVSSNSSKGNL